MKTRSLLMTVMMLFALTGRAQIGVYVLDLDGDWTNVRNAPKGKIVGKLPAREGVMIDIDQLKNGWWRLTSPDCFAGDEEITLKGSTTGYWVHWSVVAMGTRNYGGQKLTLRKEPSEKSAAVFSFTEELQLHIMDMKGDWMKVQTLDGKHTGWIESEWLCGNSLTNCC